MKAKIFDSWVLQGVEFAFSKFTPKFLIMVFNFGKIKGVSGEGLQQEIWKLKYRPEAFIQKVPPLAQSKLIVKIYEEKFAVEPANYTKVSWCENSAGDEKQVIYTGGKELKLGFFRSAPSLRDHYERALGYLYHLDTDYFRFEFMHPLTGKEPEDKLYQFTKDVNCSFGSLSFMSIDNGYTGKFCAANCPFTFKDLVPDIIKSLDKQFDFVEVNGGRMQWYEELLAHLKNPSKRVEPTVFKHWMSGFYQQNYERAVEHWDRLQLDFLLGEDLEETKQK